MPESSAPVHDAAARAARDVALFRCAPQTLSELPLGRFSDAGVRSLLLRRLLLRLPLLIRVFGITASGRGVRPGGKAAGLLEEAIYWRTARSLLTADEWARLAHGPVILMYHALGAAGENAGRYITPRATFERQLRWLKSRGYHLFSLRQLIAARAEGLAPPRAVVLTFDDGYRDNVDTLLARGAPATVFVVTSAVGAVNGWDAEGALRGRALFGWDEARDLARHGVEIGGHSRAHVPLSDAGSPLLEEEVRGSLGDLRRELGPGIFTFAYPHGRFDDRTMTAVASARSAAG